MPFPLTLPASLGRLGAALATTTLLTTLTPGILLAQATESDVLIPVTAHDAVVGTLRLTEGDPAPVVLLLHGFTGSRDELMIPGANEGIFARTARMLSDAGYSSLRIDFRGSGDSTGEMNYSDTTFESQVQDAMTAVDYLKDLDSVDGDALFLLGWSQGGLVSTATAGRSDPGTFDAVALWAAVADPVTTYSGLLGEEAFAAGLAAAPDAPVTAALPWGADVTLKGAFFDGVESFDPEAEIAGYNGPLFVAQGTEDTTVAPASAEMLIAAHDGPTEAYLDAMDHSFNAFTTTENLDALIAATIAYYDLNGGK